MVRTHFLWPRFSQLTPLVAASSLVVLVLNVSQSAEPPETNASEVVVTAEAEPESPTSPSEEQAAEQKRSSRRVHSPQCGRDETRPVVEF